MEKENNEDVFLQMKEQEKQDSQQEKHVNFVEEELNPLEKRHNFSRGVQVLHRTLQKREKNMMETFEKLASSPDDDLLLKNKRKNQRKNNVRNIIPFLTIDDYGEQNMSEGLKEKFSVADESTEEQMLIVQDKNVESIHQREKENEMKMVEKQLSTVKKNNRLNLFPNDSSVKMFREINDEIVWEDPKNLIPTKMKEEIEISLKQKEEKMANLLFECLSNWIDVPVEANPFLKELMFPMSQNVAIEKRDKFSQTPLHFCSTFDAEKAVDKLIERGAKVDATDEVGWTALHFAASNGAESSCKVLCKFNANVNARTELGKSPLMFGAKAGHVGVVTQLLEAGAETKIEDTYCLTASYYANRKCRKLIREYETNKKENQNRK